MPPTEPGAETGLGIGIFTDSYRPYTSGVVHSIEIFARHLRALGHRVYIFAPSYPNCAPEEGVFRFWAIPAPTQREFSLALPLSLTIGATVRRLGLDVIHVHSPFLLGRLGARVARRFGLPLVFTYHTLYEKYVHYVPFFQGLSRRIVRRYTRAFCNQCDLVIAPTAPIADLLRQQGVNAPLAVIPTGIELAAFQGLDRTWLRRRYSLPPEARILLYVGRLGREKNLGFLLQSFARLRNQAALGPLKLVLIGGGAAAGEVARQVKDLGLQQDVVLTGTLPKEEVARCYAGADLFVFASLTETQGLVLAEAKAAGLAVVAVDASGVREMVLDGEDGYLTPLSLDTFTERVAALLRDDAKRLAMGERARENVRPYAARETTLRLAEHYRLLVAAKAHRLEKAV
ncbi:MAG: glycosyltransferase family 4 protein [Clostridia bacterium]|nr:glycosyltransferase family 4 protein [Clostridia bacterium]